MNRSMKRMIRLLAVLVIAVMMTGLSACSSKGDKLTLMIYMIGSDLESKSGLGTEDLEEIAGSGISTIDFRLLIKDFNGSTIIDSPEEVISLKSE